MFKKRRGFKRHGFKRHGFKRHGKKFGHRVSSYGSSRGGIRL